MTKKGSIGKNKKQGLINYHLGDFLIRIKNASLAGYRQVKAPFNKLSFGVAGILAKEGYLSDVKKDGREIVVSLVYRKKEPLITDIKLISKPGLRVYMDIKSILEKKGPSFFIISTSKGLMTSGGAIKSNIGGEVLVEIS